MFPDDTAKLQSAAQQSNIVLDGPHRALVVQGDDEVGALARIHEKLRDANVHVSASTGVADGKGGYGYIIYIRPEEYEVAAAALAGIKATENVEPLTFAAASAAILMTPDDSPLAGQAESEAGCGGC